jgi:uncharacterized protein (TIGR00251 family)
VKFTMKTVETNDGVIIDVFVKPRSDKFAVKLEEEQIVVFSTEEPVKGKVNKELIKELTRFFGGRVEIVSGLTSRQKRLLIRSVGKSQVENLLRSGMIS